MITSQRSRRQCFAATREQWIAEDLAGKGAATKGSRWNHVGDHLTFGATSVSLAAKETRAHFGKGAGKLPCNRFLVRIDVPQDVWEARQIQTRPPTAGWDAIPEGLVSRNIGSGWVRSASTALLAVPSVVIHEEDNILLNPAHPDAALVTAAKVRRFVYEHRV